MPQGGHASIDQAVALSRNLTRLGLLRQVDTHAIVVDQRPTQVGRVEENRKQNDTDQEIRIGREQADIIAPDVPAVRTRKDRNVVETRMCKSDLEFRTHGLVVGLESLSICLHLDQLLDAREDGGDRCDEAYGLHVVCTAADVGEGGPDGFDKGRKLELGGCSIQDIETPGETEEGDGEVHGGGVERMIGGHADVCAC